MQATPPAERDTKMLDGAERGDVAQVKLASAAGANVNCTDVVS